MSVFESYDETSKSYDRTRVPVGAEIILDCLARQAKPLAALGVLDAGCGTGAYSQAIAGQVGRVDALDMSQGMLEAARAKLRDAEADGRIAFHRGAITELPFRDESFDAVMINQVVHHLGDTAQEGFVQLRRVVGEFRRVLRPGGALIFNHCSQSQLREGYWYAALIPEAAAAFAERFAPLETLHAILDESKFLHRDSFVPLEAVCQGKAYFDGRGPLRKAWRDGDSIWALVAPAELERALAKLGELDRRGGLAAYVAEKDAKRPGVGQITFLHATRS